MARTICWQLGHVLSALRGLVDVKRSALRFWRTDRGAWTLEQIEDVQNLLERVKQDCIIHVLFSLVTFISVMVCALVRPLGGPSHWVLFLTSKFLLILK